MDAWIKVYPSPLSQPVRLSQRFLQDSQTEPAFGTALSKVNDYLLLAMVCAHACVLSFLVHSLPGGLQDSGPHADSTCPDLTSPDRKDDQATFQLNCLATLDKNAFSWDLRPCNHTLPAVTSRKEVQRSTLDRRS